MIIDSIKTFINNIQYFLMDKMYDKTRQYQTVFLNGQDVKQTLQILEKISFQDNMYNKQDNIRQY